MPVEYQNLIGFWGGLASILALVIILLGYAKKLISNSMQNKERQEQQYKDAEKTIAELASKATTYQKRQDIFIYLNSLLSDGRHTEIRLRLGNIAMHIISFVTIFPLIIMYASSWGGFEDEPYFVFVRIGFAYIFCYLLYQNYLLIKSVIDISKLNNSYAKGYLRVIKNHIDTNFQ